MSKKKSRSAKGKDAGGEAPVAPAAQPDPKAEKKARKKSYEGTLARLQAELAHLQAWVRTSGARIVIVFEGRDAAGKGGTIKRLTERLSPRVFRVVALPAPSDREKTQIYFQRYMAQLPSAGEVVVFDRSWYNRAGVERVMEFTAEAQVRRFLELAPAVEKVMVDNGIMLLKYFLDVSEDEQERRFRQRIDDPVRQWKLSPMDVESYRRWWDYTRAYADMIRLTDSSHAPWWVVPSDDKRQARLNVISHILSQIPYERIPFESPRLGKRQRRPKDFDADIVVPRKVPDVTGSADVTA